MARIAFGYAVSARGQTRFAERFATPCSAGACSGNQRRQTLGTRLPGKVGRSDRETSYVTVRAPALALLAKDEVRGYPGARRWRIHGSAGQSRWSRRIARGVLRQ